MKRLSKSRIRGIREALAEHMNAEANADIGIAPDALGMILDMLDDAQTHGRRIQDAAVKLIREKADSMGALRSMDATYGARALRTAASLVEDMSLAQALKENPQ